ncbi:MAG: nucleotide exchange factor GrpE [Gammaproteobacteria bacterium]
MENEEHTSNGQGRTQTANENESPALNPGPNPAPNTEQFANPEIALLLEEARGKADENWNQFLNAKADMENLRRRNQRDVENAHKYGLERFALELLPVRDSLELGLAASDATAGGAADVKKLREGMELTQKMLQAALEKFGITELNPLGERFNPEFHQAMLTQEAVDAVPNTILTVCQKGYLLQDRLIRPAMVIVSKVPNTAVE